MTDPYDGPIPPRHGESEQWHENEQQPVCPYCGGLVRAEILTQNSPTDPARGAWKCDLHGEVTPRWEYTYDEEEYDEE